MEKYILYKNNNNNDELFIERRCNIISFIQKHLK